MKKLLRYILITLVLFFAIVGLVFTSVFFAMRFGVFNVRGSIAERNRSITGGDKKPVFVKPCVDGAENVCDWNGTPEWATIKAGLSRDNAILDRVSAETGVSKRMIASVVVPEQTRFFTANRDVYKSFFEPLKILGSLSQFSLGVSGIKEDTARMIELHAKDPQSPFYPGAGMTELIAYPEGVDHDEELFARLTDSKNHYFSYLYTALFIKEVEAQWRNAGHDISERPGIIVTLFNLGFVKSFPKADPKVAGASIQTGGTTYTYGELGQLFYDSEELTDIFPR